MSWGTLGALARRAEPRKRWGGRVWEGVYPSSRWGGVSAKSALGGALSTRNMPHLGHFLREICPTWGTFTAKCAPPGAFSPRNLPHLGHFLREICPTWGTLSVKCAPLGALYAIRRGILGQGAGPWPLSPRPCVRPWAAPRTVCNYKSAFSVHVKSWIFDENQILN